MSTTAPVIWTTWPIPDFFLASVSDLVATAMDVSTASLWRARQLFLPGLRAGRDLDHLAGDVGLANLVVAESQVVDQVFGVLGGVLHRDHAAGLFARLCFQDGLEQPRGHV